MENVHTDVGGKEFIPKYLCCHSPYKSVKLLALLSYLLLQIVDRNRKLGHMLGFLFQDSENHKEKKNKIMIKVHPMPLTL